MYCIICIVCRHLSICNHYAKMLFFRKLYGYKTVSNENFNTAKLNPGQQTVKIDYLEPVTEDPPEIRPHIELTAIKKTLTEPVGGIKRAHT